MTPLLSPDSPLARAMERGRERFNARVAEARRRGRRVEPAALLGHLSGVVAPIVEAVERADAKRLDAVAEALFDLSLELVPRDVLGPSSRHPRVVEAWKSLLPRLAPRLADEPLRVAGAVTNAAHNLGLEPRARPADWIAWMGEIGPRCPGVAELLACGQVLAWRCGLAHFRASALQVWEGLPDQLAREVLGLPRGSTASRASLREALGDPWRRPGAEELPPRLKVVAQLGGFRGFGGQFLTPPRVFAFDGAVWAADSERSWTVHADCFGQTLKRSPRPAPDERQMGPAMVEPDGTVSFSGLTAKLPELDGATGFAAADALLAVTLPRTHRIALVARVGCEA